MFGVKKKKTKSKTMQYEPAPDLQKRMQDMILILEMEHIPLHRVKCIRSFGSKAKRTLARCHALGKVMQNGMGTGAFYTIEFLELFDKQTLEDQDKTIIHELMHIPKAFGGGFRHHDYVCDKNVDIMHEKYESMKKSGYSNEQGQEKLF
tara:strand:+ start:162 stop:608 length:447 start_codon:yes stop_codon:yes gene_type:complete